MDDYQFDILNNLTKAPGNMGTDFHDGFMLANDYEFIIYGGYLRLRDESASINEMWSLARYMIQNGATPLSDPGEFQLLALDNITRYIASAGSVNVPSENKAYVFSGATGKDWGPFFDPLTANSADLRPYGNSSQLISVDMSIMGSEVWSNVTLPSSIHARIGSELVWIPVGAQGTLVAIGGSINRALYPYEKTISVESQTFGDEFINKVHLYDIANDKWYTQQTFGETLSPKAQFCTVVASSKDNTTHQIYAYGGHDDLSGNPLNMKPVSADVYVLSLPSFTWTKVYDGTDQIHRRKGHKCHKVADNQMMVVGGRPQANAGDCLRGGLIRLFNLNTLQWEDKYDPRVYDSYKVPTAVSDVIGGNEDGGGTLQAKTWDNDDIKDLFNVPYTKTIPIYWPYSPAPDTTTTSGIFTTTPASSDGGNGLPSYVPPLLGAILGLLGLITILCGVLFWLRRKKRGGRGAPTDSAASTTRKNRQTWSWLLGVYGDEKREFPDDQTPGTEMTNPYDLHSGVSPMTEASNPTNAVIAEAQGRQVFEMADSSKPQELHSSPMTLAAAAAKRVTIVEPASPSMPEMGPTKSREEPRPEDLRDVDMSAEATSRVRREETRLERDMDPRVLQRLLDDPGANLHDD
ncbi:uncharacterized protein H6S33_010445 [Morchella sextelata]|uniref:uncharacterized protein n=1 Tax=Morchella sextelata TaxID=1174677 RepID=UPI001D059B03|nr:uncharacterized protein H6S33_010445 [Morchella sextelata]KAH0612393.1 hypothetical protein H6S33_010445 [Morchella sextelata]